MINGDKLIKNFFNKKELDLLYALKISKNDDLNKAKDVLEKHIEKLGYINLEDKPKNDKDAEYLKLIKKIYEILPIY